MENKIKNAWIKFNVYFWISFVAAFLLEFMYFNESTSFFIFNMDDTFFLISTGIFYIAIVVILFSLLKFANEINKLKPGIYLVATYVLFFLFFVVFGNKISNALYDELSENSIFLGDIFYGIQEIYLIFGLSGLLLIGYAYFYNLKNNLLK